MKLDTEVAIVGSGFAGSLLALGLHRLGIAAVVVDRARHPRFAIGESSTPIGNRVLRDLSRRYGWTEIEPLAAWGTWQARLPHVAGGLKRGFSYFRHETDRPFQPHTDHGNELLVTASADDDCGDTHWLRADVDAFLVEQVRRTGIPVLEGVSLDQARRDPSGWRLQGRGPDAESVNVRAAFVADASGPGAFLPRLLHLSDRRNRLRTRSRAVFSHFDGVGRWTELLETRHARVDEHPFDADDAAQHHLLDNAWMWMLRFSTGRCSAGVALDMNYHGTGPPREPVEEWRRWLVRYPSLAACFREAQMAPLPGKLVATGRLQRWYAPAAGSNWALLPHTAGFIDPLHSTGIAHTLCGIEFLLREVFEHPTGWRARRSALQAYAARLSAELVWIDQLVSLCYRSLDDFDRLAGTTMLYFAAATSYEHRREEVGDGFRPAFLLADQGDLRRAAGEAEALLFGRSGSADFWQKLATVLAPFNQVGLCDPAAKNLYRYTAAPA